MGLAHTCAQTHKQREINSGLPEVNTTLQKLDIQGQRQQLSRANQDGKRIFEDEVARTPLWSAARLSTAAW